MRKTIGILAALIAAQWAVVEASGDTLTINNIPYRNVRVRGVAKLKISYDINGTIREKPLGDVSAFVIDSSRDFNKAEDLLKAGKAAEAVEAYNDAEESAGSRTWLKELIRYRRCKAAAAAKMPGLAVADWLAMVDEAGPITDVLLLAPNAPAAKGSSENAKAISLLEKRLSDKESPVLRAKVTELLLKLYEAEGQTAKAMMLRGSSPQPGTTPTTPGAAGPARPAMTMSVGQTPPQLRNAASEFKLRNYDAAVKDIEAKLKRFTSDDLPAALLLHGKALQMAYEKAGRKDASLLKKAGLSFMRVASCFDPSTAEAPEALYRGAIVSRQLGNEIAAANTFRFLISRHEESAWAEKAQAALQQGAKAAP